MIEGRRQAAYSVLGDPEKRRNYEKSLVDVRGKRPVKHSPYPDPEPLIPEEKTVDWGEISPVRSFETFTPSFDEIFDGLWENFSSMDRLKSGGIQGLTLEVP